MVGGIVICVIAVHPSCGRAQGESDSDWVEIRPSVAATPSAAATTGAQDSDSPSHLGPTIATGTISGLRGGGTTEMELRLRPQPNGLLKGELDIRLSGFGAEPITGFIRGTLLSFSVAYGKETYYFEGHLRSDQLSGVFESQPTGERGNWTAQTN
jgi:hypothetical protein